MSKFTLFVSLIFLLCVQQANSAIQEPEPEPVEPTESAVDKIQRIVTSFEEEVSTLAGKISEHFPAIERSNFT